MDNSMILMSAVFEKGLLFFIFFCKHAPVHKARSIKVLYCISLDRCSVEELQKTCHRLHQTPLGWARTDLGRRLLIQQQCPPKVSSGRMDGNEPRYTTMRTPRFPILLAPGECERPVVPILLSSLCMLVDHPKRFGRWNEGDRNETKTKANKELICDDDWSFSLGRRRNRSRLTVWKMSIWETCGRRHNRLESPKKKKAVAVAEPSTWNDTSFLTRTQQEVVFLQRCNIHKEVPHGTLNQIPFQQQLSCRQDANNGAGADLLLFFVFFSGRRYAPQTETCSGCGLQRFSLLEGDLAGGFLPVGDLIVEEARERLLRLSA